MYGLPLVGIIVDQLEKDEQTLEKRVPMMFFYYIQHKLEQHIIAQRLMIEFELKQYKIKEFITLI
jgi:hypothetical protein